MSKKIIYLFLVIFTFNCSNILQKNQNNIPSWYLNPSQNNFSHLYGVGVGYNLEDATKNALIDAASRLFVTISSKSTSISADYNGEISEELRQKISQNIEKISFSGYEISNSAEFEQKIYVEAKINRNIFIKEQKEGLEFLRSKIFNLEKNSKDKNKISRRNSLVKILELSQELEIKGRILKGAGEDVNLSKILTTIANYENELNQTNDNLEFYLEKDSNYQISKIIIKALNGENIRIAKNRNKLNQNQILLKISFNESFNEIYGNFISKINVGFENYIGSKIIASNQIEISGSSVISKKESLKSALKRLDDKILEEKNIMKILGITN